MSKSIQIRQALARLERRGRGIQYPAELRARLISETRTRREAGQTLLEIGSELGVPWRTLARWCAGERRTKSSFRAVEIVPAPRSLPTVHGPRGLRIEGLDLDGIAELIRRLA